MNKIEELEAQIQTLQYELDTVEIRRDELYNQIHALQVEKNNLVRSTATASVPT